MAPAAAECFRHAGWRVAVLAATLLFLLTIDRAAAETRLALPPGFDRVTFAKDGSGTAAIYQARPGADSVLLVKDTGANFQRIRLEDDDRGAPTVVVATGLVQSQFVALRPSGDMTRLYSLNAEDGTAVPLLRIPAHRAAFADVTFTGQLFTLDQDRTEMGLQVIDLCSEIRIEGCFNGKSAFGYGKAAAFFDLTTNNFAVDPISELLVAVDRNQNALVAWDIEFGEVIWGESLSRQTRQTVEIEPREARPIWIEPLFTEDGARFLAGPYGQTAAALYEINREFRDWRQVGRIDRGDLETKAPISKSLDFPPRGDGLSEGVSDQFVTRAVSATNDRLVLISDDRTKLHTFLVNQKAFVRHADIDLGGADLLDFDLSEDGLTLALLFDQQLVRIDWSELDWKQTATADYGPVVAIVQQLLIEKGFQSGVADGRWSIATQGALSRYLESGASGTMIEKQMLSEQLQAGNQNALLAFLGDSLSLDLLLSAGMDEDGAMSLYRDAVRAFVAEEMPEADPAFALKLFGGPADGSRFANCASQYSLPPKQIWRNVIGVAEAIETAAERLDTPLPILSGYQPEPMLDCTGLDGILADQFGAFAALEVARTNSVSIEALQNSLPGAYTAKQVGRTVHVFNDGFRGFLLANTRVIRNISPRADEEIVNYLVSDEAIDLMIGAGINTRLRYAHFLAQVMTETGGLRTLEENLNFSADALLRVFSRRTVSEATANEIARDPRAIANLIYSDRMGNRGPSSDDGWTYRGRGFFQFTGRADYERLSAETGIDFVGSPDLLADPPFALRAAVQYWTSRNINAAADKNDHLEVRRLVTGPAAIGADQSRTWFNRIWKETGSDAAE